MSSILTTDIDTFWRHRSYLRSFGIDVFRPTEVLTTMQPAAAAA